MPIITECTEPGCEVKTMGPWCIEHEREKRPWPVLREVRASDGARVERPRSEHERAFSALSGATRVEG